MKIIIALGGNAIIKKGEKETSENLIRNIKKACKNLTYLIDKNEVVVCTGNGPEIGYLLLQNELAKNEVPMMPLDVLGAESQGLIGYLLVEQLRNSLKKDIGCLITQALVDKKDKAFKDPTKFIGPFYSKRDVERLKRKGWKIKEDFPRGYRRVVASPKPIKIIEEKVIKKLVNANVCVVASIGGGVPVCYSRGKLEGVEAVIDKDKASACLGKDLGAELFLIITDVDKVYLNYGRKNQEGISRMGVLEAKKYLLEGHFPDGSMGPKIEAAIDFLKKGKKVIITNIANIEKALEGEAGTLVVRV